jgi:hypothetical protein
MVVIGVLQKHVIIEKVLAGIIESLIIGVLGVVTESFH